MNARFTNKYTDVFWIEQQTQNYCRNVAARNNRKPLTGNIMIYFKHEIKLKSVKFVEQSSEGIIQLLQPSKAII